MIIKKCLYRRRHDINNWVHQWNNHGDKRTTCRIWSVGCGTTLLEAWRTRLNYLKSVEQSMKKDECVNAFDAAMSNFISDEEEIIDEVISKSNAARTISSDSTTQFRYFLHTENTWVSFINAKWTVWCRKGSYNTCQCNVCFHTSRCLPNKKCWLRCYHACRLQKCSCF